MEFNELVIWVYQCRMFGRIVWFSFPFVSLTQRQKNQVFGLTKLESSIGSDTFSPLAFVATHESSLF